MADVTPTAAADVKAAYDAELALVKARLAVLETDAKTDWADVKAWLKTNWLHLVTWTGVGALVVKIFGIHLNV